MKGRSSACASLETMGAVAFNILEQYFDDAQLHSGCSQAVCCAAMSKLNKAIFRNIRPLHLISLGFRANAFVGANSYGAAAPIQLHDCKSALLQALHVRISDSST